MSNWFKRNGIHLAIIGIFILVCFFYFAPAFQGKALGQNDVVGAQSTQTEINKYKEKDTTILWTNQIFGGMPAFQIWAPYSNNITSHIVNAINITMPSPIGTVLILLLGSYFLFCVLKLNPWLAAAGAIAFTFTSYNITLFAAGHSNQIFAIAFFAPLLASIILTFRGKYWLGASLTALFLAMEIRANHVQMTYYLMMAIFILLGIELYHAIKGKVTQAFIKSFGYLAVALIIGIGINASLLWSTYEYGKYTTRGQSNLTQHTKEPSNGLARDYAYGWSQGVTECLTFLVPNAYGGATGENTPKLDGSSETVKAFTSKNIPEEQAIGAATQITGGVAGLTIYWGDKPSTSGPYYFGAVICFLFIFGLIIVKNRLKWWILATVILTMLLSFGKNFPYVSDLFFKYVPLYNKFRTVESILAVTGLCFAILAILAIRETIDNPDKANLFKKLKLTLYITGGLTLVLIIFPTVLLSFRSSEQLNGVNQLTQLLKGDNAMANTVSNAVIRDRESLERSDAIRSLVLVLITFGILWAFIKQKISATILSVSFLVLILADLWQVDKRYLKDESFQDRQASYQPKAREIDQLIQRDPDPDYRVVDLAQAPTYDVTTPFFHKSLWGYSAAKLKRFDELLDGQFSKSLNQDVLDMMNVKYIITQDPTSGTVSMKNNGTACGHAWFVKNVEYVKNADEEMQAITAFSPKDKVIVDQSFKKAMGDKQLGVDPNATIKLTSYFPDHMVYQSGSTVPSIAVFSEIYYDKGWTMLIDGKEAPYFRADYLLRAAQLPAGNHKVEFIFHPASYYTGETISLASSILLVLALGGVSFMGLRKKQEEAKKAA